MKQFKLMLGGACLGLLFAACTGGGYSKTPSGLAYKIISDKKNPVVKPGQIIKFTYLQKVHDSVLVNSDDNGPAYVAIDSATPANYNPAEIFSLLRKGDSAVIVIEADTIKNKNGGQLPPFLKNKDKIFLMIKISEVFATNADADKDRQAATEVIMKKMEAEAEVQKTKDLVILNEYLKTKNIKAQSAPKGTLVEILQPGSGAAIDSGKYVTVHYTGKTIAGKVFDSSIDSAFGHPGQPYTLMIGGRGAIQGWDDGLRLFRKGGKGRLYIPSALAYGKRGAQPDIQPDENLIFDVEIVDVADKRPEPKLPPAPPMPQTKPSKK
ncbi:MAG: FKBP-type peptidyl-prolyl cis-trans isomerase [Chitinophagaceae bacterium]